MKPEHWQQLDELFHAALERAPAEWTAFLDQACAGDPELRKQVEALLAAHAEAGSFIESPAMEIEARGLAADQVVAGTTMHIGKTVSHYEIISLLGSGGMGEVYLARDLVLSRQVALKLLPEYFSSGDRDRLRRFQQEARAASALNHPNIITIHETGQVDDRYFIATEFIDGATLRQRFFGDQKQTSAKLIREVLDIAIQTADALAAAHEAGIVHRDIKPENIMLRRRDGYVKVLDFGLAKLTEGTEVAVDLEGSTKALLNTSAGLVMGTANYMSPEQAKGEKVDARTDIWSLGVVLYELVAGSAPFDRPTPSEVIALILEREPPPLTRYARQVPPELERIVSKALTKNKEERYQSAKDLLVDLRRLRQRLDIEAEIERTSEPQEGNGHEKALATGAEPKAVVTGQPAMVDTLSAGRSTSGQYLASKTIGYKRAALLLVVLILAIAAGGYGIYSFSSRRDRPAAISFESAKKNRLTTTGKARRAAISPDGQFVMHVVHDAGQESLRLRQVVTTSDKEIIAPAHVTYRSLTFTPDGNYVYYILESNDLPERALYQVSILGGEPKKLLMNLGPAAVTFSPDGKRFAFIRVEEGKESTVMIANSDGSGERKLVTYYPPESCGLPAWSRDGKTIAYVMRNSDSNDMTVFEAQVADGSVKPLTSKRWLRVQRMAWLRDGSGLLTIATDPQEFSQIWYLSYPEGESRRLTNDLIDYGDLTLTEDSRTLATVPFEAKTNLWIAPEGDATRARQITFGVGQSEGRGGISWSPDGRIVYDASMGGVVDILIVDADGKNQKQLTANARFNSYPSVAPDGRYIFFLSDRTGVPHIWRMDFDGSNQKQLTSGGGEQLPRCSPDGRWVVYSTVIQSDSAKATAWRVPSEGGEPMQLTDKLSHFPTVSPDGKLVAYVYKDENFPWRIAIAPIEGGPPIKTFDVEEPRRLHWMPDGRAIAYVDTRNGISNIFAQPLDGGAPKQVTDFKSNLIFSFDWSRDGKQLALSRGTVSNDVVVISNFMSQH